MNIQNLIDAYKKMYANVEWHIKTNEPKGSDLQICQEKLSHYTDIIQELESLDESKAAIARLAQKHNEIDFCEWVGNNFIQTYSADGSVRWEEKKDSRFYKTAELWNLKSPSPVPPTSLGVSAEETLYQHWKNWADKTFKDVDTSHQSFNDNFEHSFVLEAMEQYASSLLKEKEDEIKALKNIRDVQNEVMLQNNQNYQKCVQENSQLQSSLDKANEEIKKYVGIAEALMGAAKKIDKLQTDLSKYKALAEAAGNLIENFSPNYMPPKHRDAYKTYQTLKQQL